MFDNIGAKIKTVAVTTCLIGIVLSVISGLILIATGESTILVGILIMIGGPIASWLGSFLTYGFGQLIENSDILVQQGYARELGEWEEDFEN